MHCLCPFFRPAVWNSDVMAGAPAAILGLLAMAQLPGASISEGFTGRDPLLSPMDCHRSGEHVFVC